MALTEEQKQKLREKAEAEIVVRKQKQEEEEYYAQMLAKERAKVNGFDNQSHLLKSDTEAHTIDQEVPYVKRRTVSDTEQMRRTTFGTEQVISSRLSKSTSIVSTLVTFVVCAIVVFLFVQYYPLHKSSNVDMVRNACPYAYPGITYDEAFGSYYSSPKWLNKSTNDQMIIRFSGDCTYFDQPVHVVLNFWVDTDDNVFSVHDGTINGRTIYDLELAAFVTVPFDEYKK